MLWKSSGAIAVPKECTLSDIQCTTVSTGAMLQNETIGLETREGEVRNEAYSIGHKKCDMVTWQWPGEWGASSSIHVKVLRDFNYLVQ